MSLRRLTLAIVTASVLSTPFLATGAPPRELLCSTFPVHLIVRNVTQGREGVAVDLLLPPGWGCPHDYALSPHDLQRIVKAEVLVINGLGMEEFLGLAVVKDANRNLIVIDTSQGIAPLIGGAAHPDEGEAGPDAHAEDGHDHHHHHAHGGVNPHLFASPRQAARMARNVAEALKRLDPDGAALYERNTAAFVERLNQLADDLAAVGKAAAHARVVTQHNAFDYLARDMGLEVVGVVQEEPGQAPSAAEMLALVKRIRETGARAVFTEPQYAADVAKAVAREAGAKLVEVDPVATGPEQAAPDYYVKTMQRNIETLRRGLGGSP